jgi:hypothetical protein
LLDSLLQEKTWRTKLLPLVVTVEVSEEDLEIEVGEGEAEEEVIEDAVEVVVEEGKKRRIGFL